jgi:hypothetical protein
MDASHHHWFGEHNPKAHLHGAIDDASKSILALYFDTQETLNGYFHIFNDILNDHGIPELFFTDKRKSVVDSLFGKHNTINYK